MKKMLSKDESVRPVALDTKGAAAYVGLAPKTLANMRVPSCTMEGPPYRLIGSKPVYELDDLDRWLRSMPRKYRTDD